MGMWNGGKLGSASCVSSISVNEGMLPEEVQLGDTVISSAVVRAPVSMVPVFDATGYLRQKHHALKTSCCVPNTRKYATPTGCRES